MSCHRCTSFFRPRVLLAVVFCMRGTRAVWLQRVDRGGVSQARAAGTVRQPPFVSPANTYIRFPRGKVPRGRKNVRDGESLDNEAVRRPFLGESIGENP